MGRDKALLPFGGTPLAQRVVDACVDGGASEILTIGGDLEQLARLDGVSSALPDLHPGEGPLGGIITALRSATCEIVVVLACDTPFIDGQVPARLASSLADSPDLGVVIAVVDGRDQPLTAAWRRSVALDTLQTIFDAGERAPRRAFPDLHLGRIVDLDPRSVGDVDSPEDLDRYAAPEPANHGDDA